MEQGEETSPQLRYGSFETGPISLDEPDGLPDFSDSDIDSEADNDGGVPEGKSFVPSSEVDDIDFDSYNELLTKNKEYPPQGADLQPQEFLYKETPEGLVYL